MGTRFARRAIHRRWGRAHSRRPVLCTIALASLVALAACSSPAAAPTPAPTAKPAAPTTSAPAAPSPPSPVTAAASPAAQSSPAAQASPAASPAAASPVAAAPAAKPAGPAVSIEWAQASESPFYASSYLASDQGFLAQEGVSLSDYTVAGSSENVVRALAAGAGSAVMAVTNPDLVMLAIDRGAPLKIIAAVTMVPPYALVVQPDITTVQGLKGKSCVQSSLTAAEAPFLKALMAKHGLNYPNDYDIVVGGNLNDRIASMTAGAVACTMIPPPSTFQLVDQGKKEIAYARDAITDYFFLVLAVNSDWASKNHDVVVRMVRGLVKGQTFSLDPRNREAVAASLVRHKAAPEQYGLRVVDGYYASGSKVQAPDMRLTRAGLDNVVAVMKDTGVLPRDQTPSWSKYIDPAYWEEATGQKLQIQ